MTAGLLVAPCSREAAQWAVEHWHYAGTMPLGRAVTFGCWWDDQFRGAIVYARGNNLNLGGPFGLGQDPRLLTELCRVALGPHPEFPVTMALARSLALLHDLNPGLRLVVSFADPAHDHHGGIYQAGNWIYTGTSAAGTEYLYNGKWVHQRDVTGAPRFYDRKGAQRPDWSSLPSRKLPAKHRYAYPLDRVMRRALAKMAQPYPRSRA